MALATTSWAEIAEHVRATERRATVARATKETDIRVEVDLDGHGPTRIDTGLKFYDHMIAQIPHHSGISLLCTCKGDLEVDEHHTMEDVAIALGEALRTALGDKRGIDRYGFVLPMDECDAAVVMDFGGRTDFQWDVPFTATTWATPDGDVQTRVPVALLRHAVQPPRQGARRKQPPSH